MERLMTNVRGQATTVYDAGGGRPRPQLRLNYQFAELQRNCSALNETLPRPL
jgi:hypothetical protein